MKYQPSYHQLCLETNVPWCGAASETSSLAYKKSITLIRDFDGTLPIPKHLSARGSDQIDSILLLTPLLNPIYPCKQTGSSQRLFTGEEVFQKFGDFLSNHPINKTKSYNVLHTTYTANGLTPLHESLIEQSKIVIFLTSEGKKHVPNWYCKVCFHIVRSQPVDFD